MLLFLLITVEAKGNRLWRTTGRSVFLVCGQNAKFRWNAVL
jgi:hypothetical protein